MKRIFSIRILLVSLLALGWLLPTCLLADNSGDVIFKALQDELKRTMSNLVIEDLEQPFFVSYTIDDFQDLSVKGTLGTLTRSKLNRQRYLTVDVRVGDYTLDNSKFISGFYGFNPAYFPISIDDDYDAIRNTIYLSSDKVYKDALKSLSKKKAYLQTRVIKDRPDDLFKLQENKFIDKAEEFSIDQLHFEGLVKTASKVFRDYPMINSSELKVTVAIANQYLVNSEGTRTMRGDRIYVINLTMSGKSEEGEDIKDADQIIINDLKDFPQESRFVEWAKDNAERMKSLVAAETIEEYAGPVIFADDGAGEFLRQLFAKNISNSPSPLIEDERMSGMMPKPELTGKVKRRVLPAFIDVYDDPTIDHYDGLKLVGKYEVDDVGGVPIRIQLVDKGKLVNLPIGTAPTKKIKEPNGHARGALSKDPVAKPANLILESSDKVSFDQLVATMLELCQDVDLEYGLVIRKLEDPNAPSRAYGFFYGPQQGKESALSVPLEVYKVYADGRKKPVRNLEFSNVTVRILRDILQTGDEQHVYNYLLANDWEMPVSIVSPAILIEEIELKKTEAKIKKPPLLPSPLAGN